MPPNNIDYSAINKPQESFLCSILTQWCKIIAMPCCFLGHLPNKLQRIALFCIGYMKYFTILGQWPSFNVCFQYTFHGSEFFSNKLDKNVFRKSMQFFFGENCKFVAQVTSKNQVIFSNFWHIFSEFGNIFLYKCLQFILVFSA